MKVVIHVRELVAEVPFNAEQFQEELARALNGLSTELRGEVRLGELVVQAAPGRIVEATAREVRHRVGCA